LSGRPIFQGIRGLAELTRQLKRLEGMSGSRETVQEACRAALRPIVDRARMLAPRASGVLADSIGIQAQGSGAPTTSSRAIMVSLGHTDEPGSQVTGAGRILALWRWHFAEFGTQHSAARPFLRPAWDQTINQAKSILKSEMQKAVDEALRGQG